MPQNLTHPAHSRPALVVILGPTGVGKTDLAINVARHFNTEIINADSRQVYKDMTVGTASPTAAQLSLVRHHCVAMLSLTDYYSASLFEQDVLRIITAHHQPTPLLLSGGSMMYIDAVCNGIDDIPTVDDNTRLLLKQRLADEGLDSLLEELKQLDPQHYDIVDRHNPRRVVHALEICYMTGKTYSSFLTKTKKPRPFDVLKIGINLPRQQLYDRINLRVDNMIANGLIDEARRLYPMRNLNALNTVGYKELFNYFDGIWTLPEAIERIKGNTRRYARKQLTWFKRDETITWFHPNQQQEIIQFIDTLLDKLHNHENQTSPLLN